MARKKQESFVAVEDLAQEFFDREKAAYEERTGETVNYVPPTPVTRTPIAEEEPIDEIENLTDGPEIATQKVEGEIEWTT